MHPFDSYRFRDAQPMPIRALSPCHAGHLGEDYLDLVIERCRRYGYNQIHVCGYADGDLDQFIHYQAYPDLEAKMGEDRSRVQGALRIVRECTGKAR